MSLTLTQIGEQWVNAEHVARIFVAEAAGAMNGSLQVRIEMAGGVTFVAASFGFNGGDERDRMKGAAQSHADQLARALAGHENLIFRIRPGSTDETLA